jgi:hypothetical protein
VDALLGVTNVPNGVWIDEEGMIVRPAEPAFPERNPGQPRAASGTVRDDMPERMREMLAEAQKIRIDPHKYTAALRDWVENGERSRYRLSPQEVMERSGARGAAEAMAAACFELGHHLWRAGYPDLAPRYWRQAHELHPANWTYKRQAWQLADPLQGPSELYESDWLSDVRKIGAENYYPPLDM